MLFFRGEKWDFAPSRIIPMGTPLMLSFKLHYNYIFLSDVPLMIKFKEMKALTFLKITILEIQLSSEMDLLEVVFVC